MGGKAEQRTEGPVCFWRCQGDSLLRRAMESARDSEDKTYPPDFPLRNE